MANFSHLSLQQALYQLLIADTTLGIMVTGVFDRPPQGTEYPYITLGESVINDWSSQTTTGTEQLVTLNVWSREGGRKQAATIMERLHTLLHQASPAVTGQTLVMIRFYSSSLSVQDDGWTYHGVMKFRSLLQAN